MLSKSWVYTKQDPVWVPETTRYKLVVAIIKIYATFGGSVFCSLLRGDSLSARSIALFIVCGELSSSLVLSVPTINSVSTAFNFLLSPFTSSLALSTFGFFPVFHLHFFSRVSFYIKVDKCNYPSINRMSFNKVVNNVIVLAFSQASWELLVCNFFK